MEDRAGAGLKVGPAMDMDQIRGALVEDLPGILAIYNDVIATSTAVYREEPATL